MMRPRDWHPEGVAAPHGGVSVNLTQCWASLPNGLWCGAEVPGDPDTLGLCSDCHERLHEDSPYYKESK